MEETLKLTIDSSGAEQGVAAFERAISRIEAALNRAEGSAASVSKLRAAVGTGFGTLAAELANFKGINVSKTAGDNIGNLARGLAGFSRVDASAVQRLTDFARALALTKELGSFKDINVGKTVGDNLASLARGLSAFSKVDPAAAERLESVARALALSKELGVFRGISVNKNVGDNFAMLARGMNSFAAVDTNAIANFKATIGALSDGKNNGAFKGMSVPRTLGENIGNLARGVAKFALIDKSVSDKVWAFANALRFLNHASQGGLSGAKANAFNDLVTALQRLNRVTLDQGVLNAAAQALFNLNNATKNFSGGAGRGIEKFAEHLHKLQVPPNAAEVVRFLEQVAKTGQALQGVRWPNYGNALRAQGQNVRGLTGDWRGLENAFSLTYQTGTLLRGLFTALTARELVRTVMDASAAMNSFKTQMEAVAGQVDSISDPIGFASEQFEFAKQTANGLGLELQTVTREFPKLASSMLLSGRSADEAQMVFKAFGSAMRVVGLSAERQQLVMLALTQGFSKGTVSAEELKRQLGEQIPGAFELMQDAIREVTGDELFNLDKALRDGKISSDAYILLARRIEQVYGNAVPKALQTASAQATILSNKYQEFLQLVASSGADRALAQMFARIAEALDTPDFASFAQKVADGISAAARAVGDAAIFIVQNIDTIIKVVTGLVALSLANSIAGLAVQFGTLATMIAGGGAAAAAATPLFFGLIGVLAIGAIAWNNYHKAQQGIVEANKETAKSIENLSKINNGLMLENLKPETERNALLIEQFKMGQENEIRAAEQRAQMTESRIKALTEKRDAALKTQERGGGGEMPVSVGAMNYDREISALNKKLEEQQSGVRQLREMRDQFNMAAGTSTKLSADGLDIFTQNANNAAAATRSFNREQKKLETESDNLVNKLYPVVEVMQKLDRAGAVVGKAGPELLAAGYKDLTQVLKDYQDQLLLESGLLDELTVREMRHKKNLEQIEKLKSQLGDERYARAKEAEVERYYLEVAGVNAATRALIEYKNAKDSIEQSSLSDAEKAKRQDQVDFERRRSASASSASDVMRATRDQFNANMSASGADPGSELAGVFKREAGTAALAEVEKLNGAFALQKDLLTQLRDDGYITFEQYKVGLVNAQIEAFKLQEAMRETPTFMGQFTIKLLEAMGPLETFAGQMNKTFADIAVNGVGQLADGLADVIVKGENLRTVLYNIASGAMKQIISAMVRWAIQWLLIKALGVDVVKSTSDNARATAAGTAAQIASIAITTLASMAAATALAAAWQPAAMYASLATGGTNAAGAIAGLAAAKAAFGIAGAAGGAAGAASGAAGTMSAPTVALATGGLVRGPGTGTSDSIPARLSAGEFVVNAAATRDNLGLLSAINNGDSVPMAVMGGGGAVVQNNVTVNVQGGGSGTGEEISRTLIPQLEAMTRRVLQTEMRPGGMLRKAG